MLKWQLFNQSTCFQIWWLWEIYYNFVLRITVSANLCLIINFFCQNLSVYYSCHLSQGHETLLPAWTDVCVDLNTFLNFYFSPCHILNSPALSTAALIEILCICTVGKDPSEGVEGNAEISAGGGDRGEMHMKLLGASPHTFWTPYPSDRLFSPINNISLKLCQTDMLQSFNTHPAVPERGTREREKQNTLMTAKLHFLFF